MHVVVLTGAGLSAESGLATFRDENGLWTIEDVEAVASIDGWLRDRARVRDFYNARRAKLSTVHPNAAHVALAEMQAAFAAAGATVTLITQNIDDLHERGGAADVVHMHGELVKALCAACGATSPYAADLTPETVCPVCAKRGDMRPQVVWFGEMPLEIERCLVALADADVFAAIGTSGAVYPAAGFVELAKEAGAYTIELNLAASDRAKAFAERREGRASQLVPVWANEMIAALGA
jgi:NAD-dependent deacetylase